MDDPCDRCDMRASTYYGANYGSRKFCRTHADEFHAEERARFVEEITKVGGPFPQTCPRRGDIGPLARDKKDEDRWEYGHGIITPELILTCSFCGSAHPDFFVEKMREGWAWIATDKNYKAYLRTPDGDQVAKFYFQHLAEEQRRELIELVNAGQVTFGESGLYRLPFFMRRAQ